MAFVRERTLVDQEIYDLLMRIDDGYLATEDEKRMLGAKESIMWSWPEITKLPNSMGMLETLKELDLSFSQVSDTSALSNLSSLLELNLRNTQVNDISTLSKLTALSSLRLSNTQVSDISALSNLILLSNLNLTNAK